MGIVYTNEMMDGLYNVLVRAAAHPEFGKRSGYRKAAFLGRDGATMPTFENRANLLERVAASNSGGLYGAKGKGSILVVGMGLGFLNQVLMDRQPKANIWGVDNGAYLTGERLEDMDSRVRAKWMPFDFLNEADVRARLQAEAGVGRWRVIVTEDIISSFADTELPTFLDHCDDAVTARGFVIHLVTAATPDPAGGASRTGDSALNWKTLEEWKELRPNHRWIHPARNLDI